MSVYFALKKARGILRSEFNESLAFGLKRFSLLQQPLFTESMLFGPHSAIANTFCELPDLFKDCRLCYEKGGLLGTLALSWKKRTYRFGVIQRRDSA